MILSDRDIKKRIRAKKLVIKPFKFNCVQPSTYDVHLSDEFRLFTSHETAVIDLKNKKSITELLKVGKKKGLVLHPGEFVLGSTSEYFEIPSDLAGKLEGKSSLGRLGLVVHATAGYIDPGFNGYITFEMSNLNRVPIVLYPGMRVGQICFFKMSTEVERPYGTAGNKYQGQKGPTESRAWKDFDSKKK
jgi:dCTP deaminase